MKYIELLMHFSWNDMKRVLESKPNSSQHSDMLSSDEVNEFVRFLHSLRMNTFVINIHELVRFLVKMCLWVLSGLSLSTVSHLFMMISRVWIMMNSDDENQPFGKYMARPWRFLYEIHCRPWDLSVLRDLGMLVWFSRLQMPSETSELLVDRWETHSVIRVISLWKNFWGFMMRKQGFLLHMHLWYERFSGEHIKMIFPCFENMECNLVVPSRFKMISLIMNEI